MNFLVETLKNASLHIHAVWLAIAYIAVILAMAVDFIAGPRKAKLAGKVTTSRALKMTTEKATKYFLPMLCLSCIDVLTSVVLPAPFFTLLMGAFNIFCEWKSVLESTHDKQELRDAANTFNVYIDTAFMPEADIKRLVDEKLDGKILFGTDAPINEVFFPEIATANYVKEQIELLRRACGPTAEMILSRTIYKLKC